MSQCFKASYNDRYNQEKDYNKIIDGDGYIVGMVKVIVVKTDGYNPLIV